MYFNIFIFKNDLQEEEENLKAYINKEWKKRIVPNASKF